MDSIERPIAPLHPTRDALLALVLGLAAGIIGLAPWLLTGGRLALQNLWATDVSPDSMPLALLPLSQYETTTIVALISTGGALAGVVVQIWRPVRRRLSLALAATGFVLVQIVAAAQSFAVVNAGLTPGSQSELYSAGLLLGTAASVIAGVVALLMLGAQSRAVATLGVGLVAVPFVSWLSYGVANLVGPTGMPEQLLTLWRWLPAVLVGLALAWCGVKPAGRVVVWVLDLVLLWLVPALFISVNYVLGTRVLLGDLEEMLLAFRQIFAASSGPAGGAALSVVVALAIGLAGTIGLAVYRRARNQPELAADPQE